MVQDVRLINEAVIPDHLIVPNPYTLLSDIPSSTTHFTVIDLKDAFFTIPLHPDCQFFFAFTWTNPETLQSSQLTQTILPQGFRDSPHFLARLWPRIWPHALWPLVSSYTMWMTFCSAAPHKLSLRHIPLFFLTSLALKDTEHLNKSPNSPRPL